MFNHWQRFACFTNYSLLDQTSARWTVIHSCRRLHKIPAHTFKELRNRPQRLLPSARRFRPSEPPIIAGFSASSTPRFEVGSAASTSTPKGPFVEASRLLCQAFRFRQHPLARPLPPLPAPCHRSDWRREARERILDIFVKCAISFFNKSLKSTLTPQSARRDAGQRRWVVPADATTRPPRPPYRPRVRQATDRAAGPQCGFFPRFQLHDGRSRTALVLP